MSARARLPAPRLTRSRIAALTALERQHEAIYQVLDIPTDYSYDEPQYLIGATVSTQHAAAPSAVRGNQTTVTRWLAPAGSCSPRGRTAVSTHTSWYDTGEPYQTTDALGHVTTMTYIRRMPELTSLRPARRRPVRWRTA
jgi:hypothetical protein